MSEAAWMRTEAQADGSITVQAGGVWTVAVSRSLDELANGLRLDGADQARFDVSGLDRLDTAGAWVLHGTIKRLRDEGVEVALAGIQDRHRPLFDLVEASEEKLGRSEPKTHGGLTAFIARLGEGVFIAGGKAKGLLNFVGLFTVVLLRACRDPRRFRPKALFTQIEQTGLDALPIVGLLSFLIGVVLAYLMSDQFRRFGAEIFTVNLVGLSILREVGVLITAIMIAGRSGSAFTAQIGTMKVNEEVDAMGTLGLDPMEVLVLPRVLALMLTLPFLTFFADIMGILGGAVMTILALDLTAAQFVTQLKQAVSLDDFMVGIVKAPVHAYIIAMVGCYEGLRVKQTAESVGLQTTTSVVESIFLVIVATAIFAIVFSYLGI